MNKHERPEFDVIGGGIKLSDQERKLVDRPPTANIEVRLRQLELTLASTAQSDALTRARLELDICGLLLDLDRKDEARRRARPLVELLLEQSQFEDAALACQFVYLSQGDDAVAALGQAAWLTPDDADGAAVAAATAHYVADLRAADDKLEELRLFTGAMLARVARRHSNIQSQSEFDTWVEKMELDQPDRFLVRLRNVIDVMTQDDWWFDREQLQHDFADH